MPGGHTDPITGTDCKWNVFRICNTTSMDAAAVTGDLVKRFGKKFFFITPDYAYGHTLQDSFIKNLKALGGEYQAEMLPINTSEFSATLIKAKAYKPNVLLNNMGGLAQINCMKQFTQFGMQKEMAPGRRAVRTRIHQGRAEGGADRLVGRWNGGGTSRTCRRSSAFVADFRKATGKTPSARHWFGYVAVHSVRLGAEKAKSLEGPKLSMAMEGMELPPDVALQPGKVFYRAGDHELMPNIFVGDVHPPARAIRTTCSRSRRWSRARRPPGRSPKPAARWSIRPDAYGPERRQLKGGRCCNSYCSTSPTG